MIPNVVSIRIALSQVGAVTSGPPERNTMATTLTNRLADIGGLTDAERTSLAARTVTALADGVYPAYKRLSDALNRLQPDSTIEAGVWELPDGDAYYDWVLRHHLSIDISPEEVHEAGLREVGRVRREIGDWLESHGYARADKGFAAALRRAVADTESITIADDADRAGLLQRHTELVETLTLATAHVFGLVPAAPVEIVRPPPHREAPFAAYYRPPPLRETGRASSTSAWEEDRPRATASPPRSRTRRCPDITSNWHSRQSPTSPSTSGHSCSAGMPRGWALYAERLAAESGAYESDPASDLGRLEMELLRAVRMVADTGLHRMRWTREEATQYLTDNTALSRQEVGSEVERYIVWPGQAPAYLVGMLEILRVRDNAAAALGDSFDLREFHDALLGAGGIPLSALDEVVAGYIISAGGSADDSLPQE